MLVTAKLEARVLLSEVAEMTHFLESPNKFDNVLNSVSIGPIFGCHAISSMHCLEIRLKALSYTYFKQFVRYLVR